MINIGINELKAANQRVNLRLPEGLRSEKAMTGKTGRCSYISNGLDAGVDTTKMAISTGHKDPRSLKRYAHVSNDALASGSLEQAKRLRKDETTFAGVDLREEGAHASASTANLQMHDDTNPLSQIAGQIIRAVTSSATNEGSSSSSTGMSMIRRTSSPSQEQGTITKSETSVAIKETKVYNMTFNFG